MFKEIRLDFKPSKAKRQRQEREHEIYFLEVKENFIQNKRVHSIQKDHQAGDAKRRKTRRTTKARKEKIVKTKLQLITPNRIPPHVIKTCPHRNPIKKGMINEDH